MPKVVVPTGVRGNVTFLFYGTTFNRIRTEESALAKRLVGYEMLFVWKVGS